MDCDEGYREGRAANMNGSESAMVAIANVFALSNPLVSQTASSGDTSAPAQVQKPAAQLSAAPAGDMAAPIPPIFTARPNAQGANESVAVPVRATPPVSSPQTTSPASSGGNPMAFFKKGDEQADTVAPQAPTAPIISTQQTAAPVTRPLSWEEIVQAEAAQQAAVQQTTPVAAKPALDPETEKLLKQAGEATRKALLGKVQKDDDAK